MGTVDLVQLVEHAADAIVVADPEGRIVTWNAAAQRIFGHDATSAVGQSLDLIIPEPQRGRHWEGYQRVMATGETRYGTELLQVPALHADGSRLSIAFTVTLLHDDHGAVSAIAAIMRDETARFAADRDLRRRLRELEDAVHTAGAPATATVTPLDAPAEHTGSAVR